ncbi:MAG TPA: hypothetical protein VIM40_07705 [Arthrobacter sp.]
MQPVPRITVEVPVLKVGSDAADYAALGTYVTALRRPEGLHLTLLHIGILADFAQDVLDWTKGITSADDAVRQTTDWLQRLPQLDGFSGTSGQLIVLGGGSISGLAVDVPPRVHEYHVSLVQGLHDLLDRLLVDNVDDFILSSPALGYRYPHWVPHVAVGRPLSRERRPCAIPQLAVSFGPSRIRNGRFLPTHR